MKTNGALIEGRKFCFSIFSSGCNQSNLSTPGSKIIYFYFPLLIFSQFLENFFKFLLFLLHGKYCQPFVDREFEYFCTDVFARF
jgi:hypothetical protein